MEDTQKEETPPTEPEPETLVKEAREAAERLEAANKKSEELIKRQEALAVEKTLGGNSEAGQEPKKLSKDELEIKEARALLAGTGLEEYAFPTKQQ